MNRMCIDLDRHFILNVISKAPYLGLRPPRNDMRLDQRLSGLAEAFKKGLPQNRSFSADPRNLAGEV